jgi:hypothetical protein
MAKYKEVHDKQRALEEMAERDEKMSKGLFVGFTFRYVTCARRSHPLTRTDTASPTLMAMESLRVRGSLSLLMGLLGRSSDDQSLVGGERKLVYVQDCRIRMLSARV